MTRLHVNASNYPVLNTGVPNTGAAYHQEYLHARIQAELNGGLEKKIDYQEGSAIFRRDIVRPAAEHAFRCATSLSDARIVHGQRTYVLPPVKTIKFVESGMFVNAEKQFGGLGLTHAMYEAFENSKLAYIDFSLKLGDINDASAKAAKRIFSKDKPAKKYEYLSTRLAIEFHNVKLNQARVAMNFDLAWGPIGSNTVSRHPSSGGILAQEMDAWANSHWTGIAEKPWRNEVLTSYPKIESGPNSAAQIARLTMNDLRRASNLPTVPGDDFAIPRLQELLNSDAKKTSYYDR